MIGITFVLRQNMETVSKKSRRPLQALFSLQGHHCFDETLCNKRTRIVRPIRDVPTACAKTLPVHLYFKLYIISGFWIVFGIQ